MKELIENPREYRKQNVGIVKGSKVKHLAPPFENVPFLMNDLFNYLKTDEIELIKSCVFHYETEFIHPFIDGNGRMGRLWQTLLLIEQYPIFEFIPFETLVSQNQAEYYNVLSVCDMEGKSTKFIEYMLSIIEKSLAELLNFNNRNFNTAQRLNYFSKLEITEFSRKDYMNTFKNISTSTASRDLKKGIELGVFIKIGNMNQTKYRRNVPYEP